MTTQKDAAASEGVPEMPDKVWISNRAFYHTEPPFDCKESDGAYFVRVRSDSASVDEAAEVTTPLADVEERILNSTAEYAKSVIRQTPIMHEFISTDITKLLSDLLAQFDAQLKATLPDHVDYIMALTRSSDASKEYIRGLEQERDELRDALTDLIHQLPTDERLADFNLDRAEAALISQHQETK